MAWRVGWPIAPSHFMRHLEVCVSHSQLAWEGANSGSMLYHHPRKFLVRIRVSHRDKGKRKEAMLQGRLVR